MTPMVIYTDSESAIKLSRNAEFHARTKHMDIQCHWIREVIDRGLIELKYIPSRDNLADLLTKPLPRAKLDPLLSKMGVVDS